MCVCVCARTEIYFGKPRLTLFHVIHDANRAIQRATWITVDLRSLFPFPRAAFRRPDVSFAFTRSRSRFHSRSRNTSACAESRERPDHRNEVQSLSCISRTRRCVERAFVVVCTRYGKPMRSTDSVARARGCVSSSPASSPRSLFNFSECPIEKQFKSVFDEFRVGLFLAKIFPRSLAEIGILQRYFIPSARKDVRGA